MHIAFVHTPMPIRNVENRQSFWRSLDTRYYSVHSSAQPMREWLWELPHWMTWLGGVLESEGFTSMEVLDFYTNYAKLDGIDDVGIYRILASHPADVYLFSPMTPNLPYAFRIADMIKSLHRQSIVVFGGVVATPLRCEIARYPSVDYVVFGRGEYALPALLRFLEGRIAMSELGNLAFRSNTGKVVTTPFVFPSMPPHSIPFPKVNLFPEDAGENIRYIRQVHALGCPFSCPFCTIQTIGQKPSYFASNRVISEIEAYRSYYGGHHHIYFGDETFTLNVPRTLQFCLALETHGNIQYDCQTRLSCLQDNRLAKALYRSGCRWLEIGIETANQLSHDLYKQRTNVTSVETILPKLRDEGVPACSFLMVGFPNENVDDMKRSIEYACSLIQRGLLHASYLSIFVPYPGTPFFERPGDFNMTLHHHDYEYYHEELPPVFDSSLSRSEDVYDVFIQGLRDLGRTMAVKSCLGTNVP